MRHNVLFFVCFVAVQSEMNQANDDEVSRKNIERTISRSIVGIAKWKKHSQYIEISLRTNNVYAFHSII